MKKEFEYNTSDEHSEENKYNNVIIVTIHGIMSDNSGLERLVEYCKEKLPGIIPYRVNYGEISALDVMDKITRDRAIAKVTADLEQLAVNLQRHKRVYPWGSQSKIIVVAHSFGTWTLHEHLSKPKARPTIDKLILFGSIIQTATDWEQFALGAKQKIKSPPINFVRPFDLIVKYGRHIHRKKSVSGSRGFVLVKTLAPSNHYKIGPHTGYNPGDFDDVVKIIKDEYKLDGATKEQEFMSKLNFLETAALKVLRAIRLC